MPDTITDPVILALTTTTSKLTRALEAIGIRPAGLFEMGGSRSTVRLLVGPEDDPDRLGLRVTVETSPGGMASVVRVSWHTQIGEVVRWGAASEADRFADWDEMARTIQGEAERT